MYSITARGQDGSQCHVSFDYYPDYCPVCHTAAEIKRDLEGYLFPQDQDSRHRYLQIIFRCPRLSCGTHFIVTYEAPRNRERYGKCAYLNSFYSKRISPNIPKALDIPQRAGATPTSLFTSRQPVLRHPCAFCAICPPCAFPPLPRPKLAEYSSKPAVLSPKSLELGA